MKEKILLIINDIRKAKNLGSLQTLKESDNFRDDLGFTSFDLAELTVRIEDEFGKDIFENGLINTVGEIYKQLEK